MTASAPCRILLVLEADGPASHADTDDDVELNKRQRLMVGVKNALCGVVPSVRGTLFQISDSF